jgi:VWFA-related protein
MCGRLVVVLVLCPVVAATARQQPPASPPHIFRAGVAAVVVDAVVRDSHGGPVTNLGKRDFELFEDGVEQEVTDVILVETPSRSDGKKVAAVTPSPASQSAQPPDDPPRSGTQSVIAIVFDRLSPEARALAYKGASSYLQTLQDDDYAGVFLSDLSLTTIQSYTNDRTKLRAALTDVASRPTAVFDQVATRDPKRAGTSGDGDDRPIVPVVASAESVGRPVDGRVVDALGVYTRNLLETIVRDQQGYATTDSLLAITTALGTLPGRKSVVFFAEGLALPGAVMPHFRNLVINANRGNVSFYTIDVAGLRVHSKDAEIGREVRAMGAAGFKLNPDGSNSSTTMMMEGNEDVLRKDPRTSMTLLAQQTGGFLVENTNDLAKAFRRIDADRHFHYLLTYTPRNAEFDGKWRTVTVRVPSRRVDIRARSGYLALPSGGAALPVLAYEGPALAALERSPAPVDLPLRAAALVFPGSPQSRVAVLAVTSASAFRFDQDSKAQSFRTDFSIVARIVDARGEVIRKSSQPYHLSGPVQQMDQMQRGDILFFRQPMLNPGSYTLEVAVHDALAGRSGVHRTAFVVPDRTPEALQVSSVVMVQRREQVRAEERQKDNPLYLGKSLIYPNVGSPVHKSNKTLAFFVLVTAGSGAAPSATLEILRGGQTLSRAPCALPAPGSSGQIEYLEQVSIETLSPGNYTLRLTVSQGERREVREAVFEIVN